MGVQTKTIFNMTVEGESQFFWISNIFNTSTLNWHIDHWCRVADKKDMENAEFEIFYLITIPFSKQVFY